MSISRIRRVLNEVDTMLGGHDAAAHAVRFNTVGNNINFKDSFATLKIRAYDAAKNVENN